MGQSPTVPSLDATLTIPPIPWDGIWVPSHGTPSRDKGRLPIPLDGIPPPIPSMDGMGIRQGKRARRGRKGRGRDTNGQSPKGSPSPPSDLNPPPQSPFHSPPQPRLPPHWMVCRLMERLSTSMWRLRRPFANQPSACLGFIQVLGFLCWSDSNTQY